MNFSYSFLNDQSDYPEASGDYPEDEDFYPDIYENSVQPDAFFWPRTAKLLEIVTELTQRYVAPEHDGPVNIVAINTNREKSESQTRGSVTLASFDILS